MLPNSFAGKWRFLWRYSSNIGENEGARKILYLWVFHAIFPGQDIPRDHRHVNTKSHLRASSDRPHQDIFRGWLQPKKEPKKWRILNISYVLCTEMALLFLQKILWIITLCLLFCNKGIADICTQADLNGISNWATYIVELSISCMQTIGKERFLQ